MRQVLRLLAALVLSGSLGALPAFAEKVEKAEGKVAPKPSVPDKNQKRENSAEWIKRCDKLKEDARMACLEEIRLEIVQRFEATDAPPASAGKAK